MDHTFEFIRFTICRIVSVQMPRRFGSTNRKNLSCRRRELKRWRFDVLVEPITTAAHLALMIRLESQDAVNNFAHRSRLKIILFSKHTSMIKTHTHSKLSKHKKKNLVTFSRSEASNPGSLNCCNATRKFLTFSKY